jgi:hypothetical protein
MRPQSLLAVPTHWLCYIGLAAFFGAVIRSTMSFFRTIEYRHPPRINLDNEPQSPAVNQRSFLEDLSRDFFGCHPHAAQRDWTQTFWLGLFELIVYPILIVSDHPNGIGWWIGLKTVPHWQQWLSHNESYVRFFLGNAMVIAASWLIANLTHWST